MPNLYASGVEGPWDYLAIDLLGSSLDGLYRRSGKDTMDLRSVCSIAIQVVSGILNTNTLWHIIRPLDHAPAVHAPPRGAASGYSTGQLRHWLAAQ